MIDGGFDPVAVRAEVGDTVLVTIHHADGTARSVLGLVTRRQPPSIVRTVPAAQRTDVALNTGIVIVFSEPMDSATVANGISLQLNGVAIPTTFSYSVIGGGAIQVVLQPTDPLAAGTTYEIVVAESALNLLGQSLTSPVVIPFTTSVTGRNTNIGSILLAPTQSYIRVADQVWMQVWNNDGNSGRYSGPLTFSSTNPSTVFIDSKLGIATAADTGSVLITVQTLTAPVLLARAPMTVVPRNQPAEVFATDSLTFAPQVLLAKGDTGSYAKADTLGSAKVAFHIGHVAHHLQIYAPSWRTDVPAYDFGVQSDTTIAATFFGSYGLYKIRCLIHPSMSGTVAIR